MKVTLAMTFDQDNNLRPETGVCEMARTPPDWPGVFIRVDHAFWYVLALNRVLGTVGDGVSAQQQLDVATLRGLQRLLHSAEVKYCVGNSRSPETVVGTR